VSKQTTHRLHKKKANVKKLHEVQGKYQYQIQISYRFAARENLETEVDINVPCESIEEKIKI
jgi:hypothetical protein